MKAQFNGREYIPRNAARNYRINTYRVLLTRGRDGMIIFVPSLTEFQKTYDLLKAVGYEEL